MECTGKVHGVTKDWQTDKFLITFVINENISAGSIEDLRGIEKLKMSFCKWKKKRSLDANGYYWTLLTKLATKTGQSNSELHNDLLAEYGYKEFVDGQLIRIPIPDTDEAFERVHKSTTYHLKPTTQVIEGSDGVVYRTYIMLRGSHTYNTEEFSRLISGLIYECKGAKMTDSEIATPDEKRILKERYGVNV